MAQSAGREQENLIRESFLQPTDDYNMIYCECASCAGRKSVKVGWFHKAMDRLAKQLDDELGQRVLDMTSIYWHIDDAFARSAVEQGWRVYDGHLFCPQCLAAARVPQ